MNSEILVRVPRDYDSGLSVNPLFQAMCRQVLRFGRDGLLVLETSVARKGEQVRVWAFISDPETNVVHWSYRFDRVLSDFSCWPDLAEALACDLGRSLPV